MTLGSLFRKPAALLPLGLALLALGLVLGYAAAFGVAQNQDEGTAAHLFQLILAADALAIGYFGLRWLPEAPRAAAAVLALQVTLAAVPVLLILILEG